MTDVVPPPPPVAPARGGATFEVDPTLSPVGSLDREGRTSPTTEALLLTIAADFLCFRERDVEGLALEEEEGVGRSEGEREREGEWEEVSDARRERDGESGGEEGNG